MKLMKLTTIGTMALFLMMVLTGCATATSQPTVMADEPAAGFTPVLLLAVTQRVSYGPTWTPGPSPTATQIPPATSLPTLIPTDVLEENQNNEGGVEIAVVATLPPVTRPTAAPVEPECNHNPENTRDSAGNVFWTVELGATEKGCSWRVELYKSFQRVVIVKLGTRSQLGEMRWEITVENGQITNRTVTMSTLPDGISAFWESKLGGSVLRVKNTGEIVGAIFSQSNSEGDYLVYGNP